MIEINLLPEELRKKESVKLTMPEVPIKKTLLGVLGAVIGLQAVLFVLAIGLKMRVGWLEGQITELTKTTTVFASQKAETLAYQDRIKQLRAVTSRRFYWSKLLDALTASTTRGVWLRSLSVQIEEEKSGGSSDGKKSEADAKKAKEAPGKVLVLEGSAIGAGQETAFIGKFLQSLKDNAVFNEIFSEIRLSNIQQRRIEQIDAYDFMIFCKFRKDKA